MSNSAEDNDKKTKKSEPDSKLLSKLSSSLYLGDGREVWFNEGELAEDSIKAFRKGFRETNQTSK